MTNDNPQNFTYTSHPFSLYSETNYEDLIESSKLHLQPVKHILNSDHPAALLIFNFEITNYTELAKNICSLISPNRKPYYTKKILRETLEDIENCEDPEHKKELINYAEKYQEKFENLNCEVSYRVFEHERIQCLLQNSIQGSTQFTKRNSKYEK